MKRERIYIAIDLKSFYASVECMQRGLDPMTTNLVVADESRTEKTICLAVSPALKTYGIPGRNRLFEVVQKVRQINAGRRARLKGREFSGASDNSEELKNDPTLELTYITAVPRMQLYMEYSTRIYNIYLKYVAQEDIHVYSIDEVLMDVTAYLETYKLTARQLCRRMIQDVLEETGITATGGIGTNLYLCKVAMDIMAKHMPADENGVRIAQLDEKSYRSFLWTHRPLTDFWRVGPGYARKLEANGMFTMGDVARCSLENEDLLYHLFGVNAQHLINHAWGFEDATMSAIKAYKPEDRSVGAGQVLHCPYTCEKAKLIVREMTDLLVLDLVDKGMVTNQMVLTVLKRQTSSTRLITDAVMELYDRIVDPRLLVRRLNITANHVVKEDTIQKEEHYEQLDLFTDYAALEEQRRQEEKALERERRAQKAVLEIQKKYGKNAILKGMNLQEGATARDRNRQIGGHKA